MSAQVGDTITVRGVVRRLACAGHVAIVDTANGAVWVPLPKDGQLTDPAVTLEPGPRSTADHDGCSCAGPVRVSFGRGR